MPLEHSPRTTRSGHPISESNDDDDQSSSTTEEEVPQEDPTLAMPETDSSSGNHDEDTELPPNPNDPPHNHDDTTINVSSIAGEAKTVNEELLIQAMKSLARTPKEPPKYDGTSDGTTWLKDFNRVAVYNSYNDTQKLAVVPFSLTRTAADWFDNVNDSLKSWADFESAFKSRFINKRMRTQMARTKLGELIHRAGESYANHFEAVLKLCKIIDSEMNFEELFRRVVQTFPPDQGIALISKSPKSTEELREHMNLLDSTIPFVNKPTGASAINAVQRGRSPGRSFPGRARSPSKSPAKRDDRPTTTYQRPPRTASPFQRASESQGPYYFGDRRTSDGYPLCNWCNNRGHTVKYSRNRANGYPARKPITSAPGND